VKAKITIYSIYDVRVNHTTYVDIDPEDIDPDTGRLPLDYEKELWQDAVNDFCSDTVFEIVEDE
jgi:hypothetical protein